MKALFQSVSRTYNISQSSPIAYWYVSSLIWEKILKTFSFDGTQNIENILPNLEISPNPMFYNLKNVTNPFVS